MDASESLSTFPAPGAALPRLPSPDELKTYWATAKNYPSEWDGRAELAASLIRPEESWFCDIGCGPRQSIRQFLPHPHRYLPADLKLWTPDVDLCDLNALLFPESYILAADVCFILGVCEYIFDVRRALIGLSNICDALVVSYCSTDLTETRWNLWVNAYTGAEFRDLLEQAGFSIEKTLIFRPGQYVIRAKNCRGIAKQRRDDARLKIRASR